MRVLVTGATGFVASHLIPALAGSHEVVALGHDRDRIPSHEGVEALVVDLRRVSETTLPDVDAIVHLAQANVPFPDGALDLHSVNTGATVALLDHARRCGAQRLRPCLLRIGVRLRRSGRGQRTTFRLRQTSTRRRSSRRSDSSRTYAGSVRRDDSCGLVAPYGPGRRSRMIPRLIAERPRRDGRSRSTPVGALG